MSSPLSNLRKPKKTALVPGGSSRDFTSRGNVPFRHSYDPLLDEVTSRMNHQKLSSSPKGYISDAPATMPSDMDLMQTMISRIAILEKRLQLQTKEISDKDRRINVLEDKIRLYQRVNDEATHSPNYVRDLEAKCLLHQQQLSEMEDFLMDYGMIWVGESLDTGDDDDDDTMDKAVSTEDEGDVWSQSDSTSSTPVVDFDKIIDNIQDLNVLAGAGEAQIQKTSGGARFQIPDAVQLILYANGIVLFEGPFRPFQDESTRICIRDICDGYFPSELQNRYPDGVPFNVVDKRNIIFKPKAGVQAFSGTGQSLGGDTHPSRLVPSVLNSTTTGATGQTQTIESTIPGPKMTMNQFLSHLPSSVIQAGKVVAIRSSVEGQLKGDNSQSSVTVVETNTMQELKDRLDIEESVRPPSGKNITTLRIRDTDNHIYVLKMRFSDTVKDVINYLDEQRFINGTVEKSVLSRLI